MNISATADEIAGQGTNGARRMGKHARRGADRTRQGTSLEIGNLIADVEDLLQKVGHIADGEIAQLRDRLQEKITRAKDALTSEGVHIAAAARNAAGATDDYVHENPWKSTGIAALAGLVLALVVFRR